MCAPSNIAVDNICEKLLENKIEILRVGHPARITSKIHPFTIEGRLKESKDYIKDSKDLLKDFKDMSKSLLKCKDRQEKKGNQINNINRNSIRNSTNTKIDKETTQRLCKITVFINQYYFKYL